ncbi:MAG TPA: hypothetical protein VM580_06295 [Labilithrix sp.]|nr:hypothetical protein [Labilithrix sp.]
MSEKTFVRLDNRDYEVGSQAHLDKIDELHKAELDALQKRLDAAEEEKQEERKKREAAEGEKDAAKEDARKAREEADGEKAKADEERKKREEEEEEKVREGTRLRRRAERLLAAAREVEEESPSEEERAKREEDEEKKMDGLSAKEVMVLAIQAHSKGFDANGKSDDYVRARFDALEESVRERRGVNGVARVAQALAHRLDSNDGEDAIDKARKARDEAMANAWKAGRNGGSR